MATIFVVDHDQSQRKALEGMLREHGGHRCVGASHVHEAMERLLAGDQPVPDVMLVELLLPGEDGLRLLRAAKRLRPELLVIVIAAPEYAYRVKECVAEGACDFLLRPLHPERLKLSVENALALSALKKQTHRRTSSPSRKALFSDFIGSSQDMRDTLMHALFEAENNSHIVIRAEIGSGVTMLARAIHDASPRHAEAFIVCDTPKELERTCMRIRQGLTGTVFIHHSLTGSSAARPTLGKILQLLLLSDQCRLILSVENRQPKDDLALPGSLLDLYSFATIRLPPLCERRPDIVPLARVFARQAAEADGASPKRFAADLEEALAAYAWPGNVKQLRGAVFALARQCEGEEITLRDFERALFDADAHSDAPSTPSASSSAPYIRATDDEGNLRPLQEIEAEVIRFALGRYPGSRADIARKLGIGRTTLYRKAQQLTLTEEEEA